MARMSNVELNELEAVLLLIRHHVSISILAMHIGKRLVTKGKRANFVEIVLHIVRGISVREGGNGILFRGVPSIFRANVISR